jgi:long-chain acyl-CoA synthetase
VIVFMTGAAGAAGASVLDRLCGEPSVERVYALAHRSPLAGHPKVRAVPGSITAGTSLGMDDAFTREVVTDTTAILHAAADTRFDAPLPTLRSTNVHGTANLIRLAHRLPRLDRVLVLSTVYVAGRRTGRIRESELSDEAGFVNGYEQSKYEMEEQLVHAGRELPLAIGRLGTIVGDSRDGRVGRPAAFHHALRLYYQSLAPMLPGEPDSPVDVIASDYAADALVTLLCREFRPGARWHVCAGDDAPGLNELLDLTIAAFLASRPAWRRRAIARPAIVSLAAFERFADSVEELQDATLAAATRVVRPFAPQLAFPKRFDDAAAQAGLAAHGLVRPAFREYFPRVVDHLINAHWACPPREASA